ncbi:hypothetical protein, partial [Pseudomonas protegens]|uniref:hypothetical protein n=1 Tax=Pseudomonas protegens TaxID=380021 RepID=UPI003D2EF20D
IDGYFNMMMIVDYANADKDFGAMVGNLEDLGDDIGVRIRCQREEIFTKMHRIRGGPLSRPPHARRWKARWAYH